jgi:hypothetical protein
MHKKIVAVKSEGIRQFRVQDHRWEDNTKMDLSEMADIEISWLRTCFSGGHL